MILMPFTPFKGQHCETTALGNLLQYAGLKYSEPMLFGLGQGLGFIYWDMAKMTFPFIGGRTKPDAITENFCGLLEIPVQFAQSSSPAKAWKTATDALDRGQPVGLKMDSYFLDYFAHKIHFAAHYAALYGYDETHAYLADTAQQGPLAKTTLASLSAARAARGPMSSPSLSFTVTPPKRKPDMKKSLRRAIRENAESFLNPPIQNLGYKGILKAGREVLKWFGRSRNIESDLTLCALLMERGGTGGALFRTLYRKFLEEAGDLAHDPALVRAAGDYTLIADQWTAISRAIHTAGKTGERKYLEQASKSLAEVSEREKTAMTFLARHCSSLKP